MRFLFFLFLTLMIFPFKAWSATFNVSTPAEFQAALDTAASNGEDDTIYVAPGTYNLTSTLTYSVADGDGSLTIEAQDPSNPPELYGRNSVQVMNINNDSDGDGGDSGQTITVRGLVFQNGNTSGWGGGLYLKTGQANILVENCQFLSNSAQGDAKTLGGGLYVAGFGGSVDIRGNTFEGNSATVGGGTHVYSSGGPINLVDNTFTSNIATITQSADAQGGGASVDPEHTTATITNNTFSNNRVTGISGDGGGLRVWLNNADDQVVVSNNHFVSNTSEGGTGGGIYINGPGDARIINNIFENNTAAYQGGGVNIAPHYITATVSNNTFYGNTARVGGGLFVDLIYGVYDGDSADIYNNIFWANSADHSGDDLYVDVEISNQRINVFNNDFSCPDFSGSGSCLYVEVTTSYSEGNNISADPLFADSANGDFHLTSDSPCIDAGDNNAPGIPTTDFEGDQRVIDGDFDGNAVVDMGADEFMIYVYYVSPSGTGTECTETAPCQFQQALNKAATDNRNSIINVATGTYSVTSPLTYEVADGDGDLTIQPWSTSAPAPVLDGGGSVQVMNINNDSDGDKGDSGQTISVRGLVFQNGNTTGWGGGLYLKAGEANILVEDCRFLGNSAQGDAKTLGGGLYTATWGGWVKVRKNIFRDNTASIGGGMHVYSNNRDIEITNNIFWNNTALANVSVGGKGGGLSVDPVNTTATLTNNTFYSNTAEDTGGGLYGWINETGDRLELYNNILWSNTASSGGDDVYGYITNANQVWVFNNDFSCSDFSGTGSCVYLTDTTSYSKGNNINADPQFADPASGNFHLTSGSPCIDAGDNNAPGIPSEDFEGDQRVIDGDRDSNAVADMGADEYVPPPLPLYTLTVQNSGTGSGTVTSSPQGIDCGTDCEEAYEEGTVVTLTASAGADSVFGGWGGDCSGCGTSTSCDVTMDSDKTCTAAFDLRTYTVTPSVGSGQGSIDPSTPQTVNHGDTVQFTLTPASCYHIDSVGGTCGGTLNGNVFTTNPVTADCTVVANFAIDTYTITATAGTGGSISPSGSVVVNCGSDQTFTITPDTGYHIKDVVVDGVSQGPITSYTFQNVTGDHTISATFEIDTYTLSVQKTGTGSGTVTSSPAGIDCGSDCSEVYNYGTVVTLTASAGAGSVFGGWGGDCSTCGTNASCDVTMDADKTCTATFDLRTYTVTPSVGTGQGSISPDTPQMVTHGSTVQFTLSPATCYHIDSVGGTCGGTLNGNVFTTNPVTADCTVVANFGIDTYTITATAGTGGSISPSGSVVVNCGREQTFTITPDPGYRIEDVVVDGVSQGPINSYTFSNVSSDHTIQATFKQAQAGTIQLSSAAYSVDESDGAVTITVERTGGSDGDVSVEYTTADGTATAGSDYGAVSGVLQWEDGDSSAKSFQIPIYDDTEIEADETLQVRLSNPTGGATLGSPSTATVTILDDDDTDGDGVPNVTEDGAPNGGDGNGDGVPDRLQGHVTSLPSATGLGYVTVVTSGGCSQNENVQVFTEEPDDPEYSYPFGLVGFELPCSSATVKVYFYGTNNLSGYTYRKYGPTTPGDPSTEQWYTLPGVTFGSEEIGGSMVAYAEFTLTDGQIGDDTGVDGRIVDQGGPGQAGAVMTVPTMTEWGMMVFMVLAGTAAVWYMRRMRA